MIIKPAAPFPPRARWRGAWLARRIIAEPPDDPPPNVPALKEETQELSLRERLEMHPEPVSVAALLEQVVTDQRAVDGDRRYHLQTQSLDGVVGAWDEGLIRRVLDNVLSNARKFSDPGTDVVVFASWRPDEIVVRVTDEGAGIAAEDLPHVFERFYRADQSRSKPGSGLGLSLVRAIVRAQGGDIAIESAPGQGTSVSLAFKRA